MGISLFQFQKGFLCSQSGLIDCSRGPFGPGWQAGRTRDGDRFETFEVVYNVNRNVWNA